MSLASLLVGDDENKAEAVDSELDALFNTRTKETEQQRKAATLARLAAASDVAAVASARAAADTAARNKAPGKNERKRKRRQMEAAARAAEAGEGGDASGAAHAAAAAAAPSKALVSSESSKKHAKVEEGDGDNDDDDEDDDDDDDDDNEETEERLARTLVVKNVPAKANLKALRKQVRAVFEPRFSVESVRLRTVPVPKEKLGVARQHAVKAAMIVQDAQATLFAFVVFRDEREALDALDALSGTAVLNYHNLFMDRATRAGAGSGAARSRDRVMHSIFCGNVPYATSEQQLFNHFKLCGEICDVRVVRDSVTRRCTGAAYVTFREIRSVRSALLMNQKRFYGRELRIEQCKSSDKIKKAQEMAAKQGSKGGKVKRSRAYRGFEVEVANKAKRLKREVFSGKKGTGGGGGGGGGGDKKAAFKAKKFNKPKRAKKKKSSAPPRKTFDFSK